jgi:PAS domain-containing protein
VNISSTSKSQQQEHAQKPEGSRARLSDADLQLLTREGLIELVQELQVHQSDLEMQYDELKRLKSKRMEREIDHARVRYIDLYDLAPVAYFSISREGLILQSNFKATNLLGVPATRLVRRPLARFVYARECVLFAGCKSLPEWATAP